MASSRSSARAASRRAVAPLRAGARRTGAAQSPPAPPRTGAGPSGVLPLASAESPAGGVVGREGVAELQRARILAAMSELVRERGVAGVTVAHIVARSGVSRRTFYELFEDREGCLLAAFEHAVERASAVALPVYRETCRDALCGWEEPIRAALGALLGFLDDEPALGRLLIVDALAAEQRVLERRVRVIDRIVDAVHRAARAAAATTRRRDEPARIVAEGVVGAVLAVVHTRLLEPNPPPLGGLLNPLMGIVVLPYLGPAAAARELARPRPRTRRRVATPADPLRGLDMRLTYRTVRVLLAISELGAQGPPPSGRQVADASGISDQGQMSKLLARLQHLQLIRNDASGRGKGEPNAWTLTVRGREVEHAIRAQTAG